MPVLAFSLAVIHSVDVYAIGAVALVGNAVNVALAYNVLAPVNDSDAIVDVPPNVVLSHSLVAAHEAHHSNDASDYTDGCEECFGRFFSHKFTCIARRNCH